MDCLVCLLIAYTNPLLLSFVFQILLDGGKGDNLGFGFVTLSAGEFIYGV